MLTQYDRCHHALGLMTETTHRSGPIDQEYTRYLHTVPAHSTCAQYKYTLIRRLRLGQLAHLGPPFCPR
ncbi:Hypothetical protein NTJ_10542 [Nesidiocoris tenuis]|uniref:Uncharacterized protein n=1 Tax=Nesidiocoris tenuis TaxID=355587 RepID=A0ABN7B0G4_9HEMI|nr:Hypothetical protein NTJ_10542 [Nesidiocoris tenuis]